MQGRLVTVGALLAWGWNAASADELEDVEIPEFRIEAERHEGAPGAPRAEVSIDTLLGTSVYVVSKKPQLLRESPGVVTILQREELLNAGARDLIDALLLVPGFFFGVDVQGVVGVGFRGNWGHEGKVLLLVDGQEMNELSYSTLQFGHHYPLDNVERIEIIRGPGSAVYGGFAELAVIHVVTRGAKKLRGANVTLSYGQMEDSTAAYGRRSIGLAAGDTWGDLSLSVSGLVGEGRRSDASYQDALGEAYDLETESALDPRWLSVALGYKDLRLRFLYDGYHITARDAFGENLPEADRIGFSTYYAEAVYDLSLTSRLTLSPRLSYKHGLPWRVLNQAADFYTDKSADRLLGGLSLSWDARDWLNVSTGIEANQDRSYLNTPETKDVGLNTGFGPENADSIAYENVAGFVTGTLRHRLANVTLGARYEHHSQFGGSFVPRLGLTKVFGRFHAKLLAARAFRAPAIESISLNPDIQPERTTVFELETGYQVSDHVFVSANAFDISIDNTIIYTSEIVMGMETEGYFNAERTGTRGAELDFRMRYGWGYVSASASAYTARGRSELADYKVPQDEDALLGAPILKVTAHGGFNVWRGLIFAPSAVFMTERYREGDESAAEKEPASLLLNAFLRYPDLGTKGLDVAVGVHNLLDQEYRYVQPYLGGHPPLPGPTRELVARVSFTKEL